LNGVHPQALINKLSAVHISMCGSLRG